MPPHWEPRAVAPHYADFLVDPRRPWRLPARVRRTPRVRGRQLWLWTAMQLQRLAERMTGLHLVGVNYVPSADLSPRYGFGKPAHPELLALLERERPRFAESLALVQAHAAALKEIAVDPGPGTEPAWRQSWLPSLDAASLYAFVRERRPARFLEVGSGWSTRFVARAKRDGELATNIISIDPEPRAEIDALCDRVIRAGLETADLAVFQELEPGDIVFIDNSHRSFTNSDVTVFFLDVLPRLPDGVLVGIHDIALPADYPPGWNGYFFNEQYLLACYLLGGAPWIRVELAALFASSDEELGARPPELVTWLADQGVRWFGSGFWFSVDRSTSRRVERNRLKS